MRADWASAPPADYVEQWMSALDRLHEDPAELNSAVQRAQAADQRYSARALTERFIEAVT
jgi:hypothetical protein